MADRPDGSEDRIAALEARVAELAEVVARLESKLEVAQPPTPEPSLAPSAAPSMSPATPSPPLALPPLASLPAPTPAKPAEPAPLPVVEPPPRTAAAGEDWITRVGIGLLLLGCAFLFKYSIDKGWLGPPARVGIGATIGVVLSIVGWRTRRDRPTYGELLLGGGIAAFHVTLFAAYFLYGLTGYAFTFGAMAAVNVLAFALAWSIDRAPLSVLGAIGAYATPFVLPGAEDSAVAIFSYLAVIMAGTGAVVAFKRWGSLLLTSFIGAWAGLGLAVFTQPLAGATQWVAQGAVVVAWVVFTAVPSLRLARRIRERDGVPPPELTAVQAAALIGPLVALPLCREIWSWSDTQQGLASFVVAGLVAVFGLLLPRPGGRVAGLGHYLAALVAGTIGLLLLFEGDVLFGALIAEAIALHLLSRRDEGDVFRVFGHLVTAGVAAWSYIRLGDHRPTTGWILEAALLLAAAAAMGIAALRSRDEGARILYGLAAHVGLMGWWHWLLVGSQQGQAFISVAWGVQALVLVGVGVVRGRDVLRGLGMLTLAVVVAKLLFVDLAAVAAHWRILLFMGFGGVLLLMGYYLPRVSRSR